jgi:hypothetical protein
LWSATVRRTSSIRVVDLPSQSDAISPAISRFLLSAESSH